VIHDSSGDETSVAIMGMALHHKRIESYGRDDSGWPVIYFDDGASLKFCTNEIDGIAIYRHAGEDPEVVYRRFRSAPPR
jgi:hypothetical protein